MKRITMTPFVIKNDAATNIQKPISREYPTREVWFHGRLFRISFDLKIEEMIKCCYKNVNK